MGRLFKLKAGCDCSISSRSQFLKGITVKEEYCGQLAEERLILLNKATKETSRMRQFRTMRNEPEPPILYRGADHSTISKFHQDSLTQNYRASRALHPLTLYSLIDFLIDSPLEIL